jgi:hypothetical protein
MALRMRRSPIRQLRAAPAGRRRARGRNSHSDRDRYSSDEDVEARAAGSVGSVTMRGPCLDPEFQHRLGSAAARLSGSPFSGQVPDVGHSRNCRVAVFFPRWVYPPDGAWIAWQYCRGMGRCLAGAFAVSGSPVNLVLSGLPPIQDGRNALMLRD